MTSVLPSTTLFREGPDLDEILAELDEEYPDRVRVVDVEHDRSGGMLGFFSRRVVRVLYTVEDSPQFPVHQREPVQTQSSPLEALLDAAEAHDMIGTRPTATPLQTEGEPDAPSDTNVEFARMLLDMAAAKAAARRAAEPETVLSHPTGPVAVAAVPPSVPTRVPPPVAPPVPATAISPSAPTVPPASFAAAPWDAVGYEATKPVETAVSSTAASEPVPSRRHTGESEPDHPVSLRPPLHAASDDRAPASLSPEPMTARSGRHRATASATRAEFSLRRALVEIGVPVHRVPEFATDPYRVVEDLVAGVPTAAMPRLQPGQVLAVVGPSIGATRTAEQICRRLRLDPAAVIAAGCAAPAGDGLNQPWEVSAAISRARSERTGPTVLIVASDGSGDDAGDSDDEWLREVLRSAGAEHVWLVTDATRKPADAQATLDTIGRADALVVTGAARTSSPASVWALGVPVVMLDGRPASRGGWAVLLIDKLAALDS